MIVPCAVSAGGVVGSIDKPAVAPPGTALRQSEIEQLRPRPGQHDVARLQVAMNNSCPMRFVERIADLHGILERLRDRQAVLFQPRVERLTLEVLHHQEVGPVLMADVVHRADVRMAQGGDGSRFAIKPVPELLVGGQLCRENLDRHRAIETCVASLVDFAHPAGTERRENLIRSEGRADHKRHGFN